MKVHVFFDWLAVPASYCI